MANGQMPGPDDTIYDDSTIRDESGNVIRPARGWDAPAYNATAKKTPTVLFIVIAICGFALIAGGAYLLYPKSAVVHKISSNGTDKESGQDVLKAVELSRIKQVSLALQIYCADWDDVLPRPLENFELIYPYLKDREAMRSTIDGSTFKVNRKYSGYPLNAIEDIFATPLVFGPLFRDGVRAVGYADSHAKLVKDDPIFATMHSAEPLMKLEVAPAVPDDEPKTELDKVADSGDGSAAVQLVDADVEGQTIRVPEGWKASKTTKGDMKTFKWEGPRDGTYIRLDITPDRGEDLHSQMLDFESRFQNSSHYKYERRNVRVGSEAYNGGVLWNFRISKDGSPMSRRTIAYWKANGNSYGLVTNSWEKSKSYAEVFTQVLNSIQGW